MQFQVDGTVSGVQVRLTHTPNSRDLRLTLTYQGSQQAAFSNTFTPAEATALAGGIRALLDGKPENSDRSAGPRS